jgi:hypothetical protein
MNYEEEDVSPLQPSWESAVALEPAKSKMIRPEPKPLPPVEAWREVGFTVRDILVGGLMTCALPFVVIVLVLLIAGCGGAPTPGGSCVDWAAKQAPHGVDFKVAVEMCREEIRAGRRPCLRYASTLTDSSCREVVEEGTEFALVPVEAP